MKSGKKWWVISSIVIIIMSMIVLVGLVSAQTGAPAPQKRTPSAKKTSAGKQLHHEVLNVRSHASCAELTEL